MAHNYNSDTTQKFSRTLLKPSLLALAISSSLAGTVVAQETAKDADAEVKLERIEVTARRTVESLQEVPVAVTSIGAADIAERGISTLVEIQQFSPNTTLQQSRGTNSTLTAFIRGVGQEDPLWGYEPGVGIYVDDVYMARPQGAVLDILNIERIEVLRGPQGTLYGKNTVGGAVKYVTKAMSGDTELNINGTLGSYNQRDVKLTAQLPLVDNTLYFGVGYANLQRDGYGNYLASALPGQDSENYNKDVQAYRLTLEYRPSDALFFRLNYDKTEDDSNAKGGYRLLPSLLKPDFEFPDSKFDSYTSLPTWNMVETEGLSLTAEWQLNDNFSLKSITAKRESYSKTNIDFDNTDLPIFDVPAIYDDEQFTQEFQLNYQDENLKLVSGAYYYEADSCGMFNAILVTAYQPALPNGLSRETGGCSNGDSTALYTQGSYDINEQWSVTAGLRYTKDNKDAVVRNGIIFDTVYPETGWVPGYVRPDGLTTPVVLDDSASWSKLTPKLGVEFQQSSDVMWFASYGKGFKSGTFNPRATVAEPAANPENVDSFEFGVKSDWFDSFRVNATLFNMRHKDRQYIANLPDPNDFSVVNQRLGNIGEVESTGLELETTWIVNRALEINANLGLVDPEYKSQMINDPQFGNVDIKDLYSITNTPKTTATIGFNYTMDTSFGDVIFNGNYAYRSKYSLVEKANILEQDSYGLANMSINWYSSDGHWNIALHGKNLTDEEYLVGNYPFLVEDPNNPGAYLPGTGGDTTLIGYYGAPRTFSLTVGYRF